MHAVDLVVCPFDLGRRNWRCGLGPPAILEQGAVARLASVDADVRVIEIDPHVTYLSESAMTFEAQRQIARRCGEARNAGRFPLVLGGNCNTAVGGVCGTGAETCGVVWFDAHGDFSTPETTDDGFLDGMGLAMVVGRCWRNAMSTIPGFHPVSEEATALVGARDLDPWEQQDLENSAITCLDVNDVQQDVERAFDPFLRRLKDRAGKVYLHVDLDVHDPSEAPANFYNAPLGLGAGDVRAAIQYIGTHIHIVGGGLASYDPAFDPEGVTAEIAIDLLEALSDQCRRGQSGPG